MTGPENVRSSLMDPLLSFKFLVSWEVEGKLTTVAGVSKIGPLRRTTQVTGYGNDPSPLIPGQTDYEEINVERGIILDVAFERWVDKAWHYPYSAALGREVSLKDFRKTLRIDLCNQAGQIVSSYYVFNCWPSKYTLLPELDAQAGSVVAIESMTLQNEGWARDPDVVDPELPSFAEPSSPSVG